MKGLSYHERCRVQRSQRHHSDYASTAAASSLLGAAACVISHQMDMGATESHRLAWRIYRDAVRAVDRQTSDPLEWRGRCHRLNGRSERVDWSGGQSTRHTVPLRERARCLLMGRDYPIAGPTGRLP